MNNKPYSASKFSKLLPTMNSGDLWQLVGGIAVELLQRQDDVLGQPLLFLRKNGRYSPEATIAISFHHDDSGKAVLSVSDATFSKQTKCAWAFPFDSRLAIRLNAQSVREPRTRA